MLGTVLIITLAGGAWYLRKSKIPIDLETNCPKAGPTLVHMLIFDRSDPITGQQSQHIVQEVRQMKAAAQFGNRFDIYTFNGDARNVLSPILSLCSPGRPEYANEWIENPEFVRRRYEERFSTVLDQTVEALLKDSTMENSPIIESLKAAAATSLGPIEPNKIPLRITMVSDMVQHTGLYSQFRSESNFAQLAKSSVWASLRPNLKGADVDIIYLLRPTAKRNNAPIQNRGHQLFWEQLVSASDGHLSKIDPI